ncbi:MAG: S41 family peptidase [Bacteroidales bacterium]|jgi:tricorn protease|nr:S41 family peptidase [Bacteroidales bacterium]
MKKLLVLVGILAGMLSPSLADTPARFISDPVLSPDGRHIVFSYENDLWRVAVDGGTAWRLTALQGREFLPSFSPDGQWIAFSASLDGNTNVFIMPAEGGEIRQLSFHEADDLVDGWSWDGQRIYFHSSRYNMSSVYAVEREGGTPERLFEHYFNLPHHLVEHPLTGELIFTESWESLRFPERKRYRGAHRPDLLAYNPATGAFRKLTDFEGKDLWPTTDQAGNLFFASAEFNDEYNLYTFRDGQKIRLTGFGTSIGRPRVSADGSKVVFEKDYQLMVYDVTSGTTTAPRIRLFQSNTLPLDQAFEVKGNITSFDVSPDNKKLAFVARGELFVSDIEGKFVRQLLTNPRERVLEVNWAADNRTLFYTRTRDGWANLYSMAADGSGTEQQIEQRDATSRLMTLSPDRKMGVYLSGRDQVMLLDLEKKTTRTLVTDELWGFQNSVPRFSPDGHYVVFTAYRNFEQEILIHDIREGKTIELTNTGVTERSPYWSPCGRYIYFTTDRTQPSYPGGQAEDRLYRIPLYSFAGELKSERFDALFEAEKKDTLAPLIRIDLEGIPDRWEPVRVAGIGRQFAPQAFRVKGKDVLLFGSNHERGEWALWKLEMEPFERNRPVKIEGPSAGMSPWIVTAKDDFYVLAGGNIQKMNLGSNKLEAINIDHSFTRKLENEFSQIFYETWAALAENFYEEGFHGVDWPAMRDRYAAHLPFVRTRENLRRLTNDMLGELNSSHMGFSSNGEEEKPFYSAKTAETGLLFDRENPYRVERIIGKSHLDLSDVPVRPGDVLVAVNGQEVDPLQDRNRYFYFARMPEEVSLTFQRGNERVEVRTRPHTPGQISDLLYDEWIAANRRYVDEQTHDRVGYVFMKDMGGASLEQFLIDMTTHVREKEALIFDIRFNRGGNVHDQVLQFLSQRPYLSWKYRGGALAPQPNFSPAGSPIVMLINERSLSDAEMTAEGFRRLGLGTIVGTETYRWIIFTSGKAMVDGSFCRLPSWGCYTLDGENLEFTGVAPDIEVHNTFLDRLNNNDPQLDRAIREAMERIGE